MKNSSPFSVKELSYGAFFVALTAICAWLSIPFGQIAFTMQTFAVFLAVSILGTRRAFFCVLAYILLGALGAPVFSGFRGGTGVLLGATGGYITGFLFAVCTAGPLLALAEKHCKRPVFLPVWQMLSLTAGLIVCYAFGSAWFLIAYAQKMTNGGALAFTLSVCVLPYILPDLAKIILAVLLSRRLGKHITL